MSESVLCDFFRTAFTLNVKAVSMHNSYNCVGIHNLIIILGINFMFIYFVSNDIMKWISLNETQLKNHFVLDIKRETFFWALLHLVGSGGICAEILLIICWRHILNFSYTKCEQRRFESSLNSCGCRWANERNLFCHDITANQNACRSTYDLYVSFLTAQKKRKKLWKPSNWRSSLVREFFVLKWWDN